MRITFATIMLLLSFLLTTKAQNFTTVKGLITDSTTKIPLKNVVIVILNAKDSILFDYTRSDDDGFFSINHIVSGKFLAIFSLKNYADYSEVFVLDAKNKAHNFGHVNMILKSTLLNEIIIKGDPIAIKIKGDTTEYNAKAYVIQPNDRVEDLIKQFPGIQVDKNGKITAQGKTVNKVLLDGEEFFGDDPTLVTQNIRADMVDKVQLYDKKSDQATFTGIDDGIKVKTLNIKLKEDKKKGYFGKIDGGIGTNQNYQGQVLYNNFNSNRKLSFYTTDANTGKTGLTWQDNDKYGDGSGGYNDNGGVSGIFDGAFDSFNGRYNNEGIPKAITGGAHYDAKFNNNKENLNVNYKTGSLEVNGINNTLIQNNLPNAIINTNSNSQFHNYIFRQKIDLTYQIKIDTSSNLKLFVSETSKNNNVRNFYETINRRANDTLENTNNRSNINSGTQRLFTTNLLYTKKLKAGRTISVSLSEIINDWESKGYVNSHVNYYNQTGNLDSISIIDQYKTSINKNSIFNSNLALTQTLSKYFAVVINYGININNGILDRESFDPSSPGIYNLRDTSQSNYLKLDQFSNRGGVAFNYKKGKANLNWGMRLNNVTFKQDDENHNSTLQRNFTNWNPQISFSYKVSLQKSWSINYSGNTIQPTILQLQPIKENTDPLNIYLGNPELTPSFANSFDFSYGSYKVLSNESFYLNGGFSYITNSIVSNRMIDSSGNSTNQYINLGNKKPYNYNLSTSYNKKIKTLNINIGANASVFNTTYYTFTNNVLNSSTYASYQGSLTLSKSLAKKYDFSFSAGPNYVVNQSSLRRGINGNSLGLSSQTSINLFLPAKFQFTSDLNFTYNSSSESFNGDIKRTIWNATINKTFLKENQLKFAFTVNDILDQNFQFYRSSYNGMLTQSTYNSIRRYLMFSIIWDFNKMGSTTTKK